jgi:hypothetical protein
LTRLDCHNELGHVSFAANVLNGEEERRWIFLWSDHTVDRSVGLVSMKLSCSLLGVVVAAECRKDKKFSDVENMVRTATSSDAKDPTSEEMRAISVAALQP